MGLLSRLFRRAGKEALEDTVPPRLAARLQEFASDGTILPVRPSEPFRTSLRGGGDDLMDAVSIGRPSPTQADLFPETAPGPLQAFHGTYDDFGEFAPWQHFGTQKAAEDRLRSKAGDLGWSGREAVGGRIIPVEIQGRRINIGDELDTAGGSTRMQDIADMLARTRHITQEEYGYAIEPLQAGDRYLGRDAQEVVGERLQEIMRKNDVGAIGYRNKYEDPGSMSYIVPDASMVRPRGGLLSRAQGRNRA